MTCLFYEDADKDILTAPRMNLCAGQGAALYLKLLRRRRRQDDRPFKKIPKIRGFKGNRVLYEDGFYSSSQGWTGLEEGEDQSPSYFVQNVEFHHSHLAPEENIYSELEFPPKEVRRQDDDSALSEDDDDEDEVSSLTASEVEDERGGRLHWFDR